VQSLGNGYYQIFGLLINIYYETANPSSSKRKYANSRSDCAYRIYYWYCIYATIGLLLLIEPPQPLQRRGLLQSLPSSTVLASFLCDKRYLFALKRVGVLQGQNDLVFSTSEENSPQMHKNIFS